MFPFVRRDFNFANFRAKQTRRPRGPEGYVTTKKTERRKPIPRNDISDLLIFSK